MSLIGPAFAARVLENIAGVMIIISSVLCYASTALINEEQEDGSGGGGQWQPVLFKRGRAKWLVRMSVEIQHK